MMKMGKRRGTGLVVDGVTVTYRNGHTALRGCQLPHAARLHCSAHRG